MPASVACTAGTVHGIVSVPAGDLVMIVELPTWFGPAFMPSVLFVSGTISRSPQLQAATSTNIALSLVDARLAKLRPVEAFPVVNIALDWTGKSTPAKVRAQTRSNTNTPPFV